MSGGYFEYKQHYIADIADEIDNVIANNDSTKRDRWGCEVGWHLPPDIIEDFKRAVVVLRQAAIYTQRIDWLLSGDDGEDGFRRRLREELEALP